MARFFWILLVLIFSVIIGMKIAEDPGYAVFAYRNWTVEMPLWFTVLAFIVSIILIYSILRFFENIGFSLYRLKNWWRWHRRYRSYSKTNRGLIELIEGHWQAAEQDLLAGVEQSDAPLINYLAAAKAAQEQKAYERRDDYLRKAHHAAPQADVAIGLTQAQLQFEQGQLEQTLATLGHLNTVAPKNKFVLKLLERVYIRLADWPALLKLLPQLRKAKVAQEEYLAKLEEKTYQELLRESAKQPEGLYAIQKVWGSIPSKIQKDADLLACYCQLMISHAEMADEIQKLLEKSLNKEWNKKLAELYGVLITSHPEKQLAHAESWHKQYGDQPALLLTLGRLSMRCQLWGKARYYLEENLKLEPDPQTYILYGKLLEQLGETQSAIENYRDGLMRSSQ